MIFKCEYCGKEKIVKYKSQIKRFCSHSCSNKYKWDCLREKGKKISIVCQYCNKEFYLLESQLKVRERNNKKVKYCSIECSSKASKKGKIVNCKNCNKEFYTTRNKFCSKKCTGEYRKKSGKFKKNGYWIENGYKVLYIDNNNYIKEHIKIMQDYIGRKLESFECVHHIDGNKLNNKIDNLMLMKKGEHSRLHRIKEILSGKKLFTSKS